MTAAVSVATKAAGAAKGAATAGSKTATAAKGAGRGAGTAAKGAGARTSSARAGTLTTAAQQREQIDRIKAARPAETAVSQAAGVDPDAPSSPADTSTSSTSSRQLPESVSGGLAAASTGSGFLLGVFAWALGLAYLQHGKAGVTQFLNAKFLNKVGAQ